MYYCWELSQELWTLLRKAELRKAEGKRSETDGRDESEPVDSWLLGAIRMQIRLWAADKAARSFRQSYHDGKIRLKYIEVDHKQDPGVSDFDRVRAL